jgi:hypothetical protein
VKSSLSGKVQRRTTKIHRTIRWYTGLSGGTPDCPVSQWSTAPTVGRAIFTRCVRRANGRQGAPDCPVCTGQCPVHQLPRICNGRMRQKRKEITHRTATVTVQWRKISLSRLPPTASCLGAIKGTPRRMEEAPKHTLSILSLPHFVSAHLIDRVSDLSSVLVVNSLCFILSSSLDLCACVLLWICVCCFPPLLLCFHCDLCCKGERLQLVEIPRKREKEISKEKLWYSS